MRVPAHSLLEKLAELQAIGDFALDADYRKIKIADAARSWYTGAIGERKVARLLTQLGPEWTVLHSVPVGTGTSDIDHIAIGPPGVFTINTKHHPRATVWVRGRGLRVNGQKQHYLSNTVHEAERAERTLSSAVGFAVPVTGVLAFVGLSRLDVREPPRADRVGIKLWRDDQLVRRLTDSRRELSDQQLAAIVAAAVRPRIWHRRPKPPADVSKLVHDFDLLQQGVRHSDSQAEILMLLGKILVPAVAISLGLIILSLINSVL